MSRTGTLVFALVLLLGLPQLAGHLGAADKLAIQVAKGAELRYRSDDASVTRFEGGDGAREFKSDTQSEYVITVKDVGEGGKLSLSIQYASLKVRRTTRDGETVFDSAKKDADKAGDAAVALLRKTVESTISAELAADGTVARLDGFPEPEGADDLGARFRAGAGMAAGRMRSDLEAIFGAGLQGKDLKAGEVHRLGSAREGGPGRGGRGGPGGEGADRPRRRPDGEGGRELSAADETVAEPAAQDAGQDQPRRREGGEGGRQGQGQGRRGSGRFGFGASYNLEFTGVQKAGDVDVLAFKVYARRRGPDAGEGADSKGELAGAASYRKSDGLLESFEANS
jgi:hypothetical protein